MTPEELAKLLRITPEQAQQPMSPQEFARLFRLTPQEAVDHMQQRRGLSPTYDWRDVWQEEHSQQFTVSRLTRLDLLSSMQTAIEAAVAGDLTRRDWTKIIEAELKKAGWWGKIELTDPSTGETVTTKFDRERLKLIFDMNTRMAFSAGRWQRFERARRTHPYLRYITKRDERVRAAHAAWDNLALPAEDPFWATHYPPNGWRCRCRVMPMSRRDYEKGLAPGGTPLKKAPPKIRSRSWTNKRTGEITEVPEGIDPGFAYNVGQAGQRARDHQRLIDDKLARAPAALADAARRDGLTEGE